MYNIITATSVSELVSAVSAFIIANPTYQAVGSPGFNGEWYQAISE